MKLCTSFFSLSFSEALSAFNLKALPMYRRKNHTHTHTKAALYTVHCAFSVSQKGCRAVGEIMASLIFCAYWGVYSKSHNGSHNFTVIYCSIGSQIIICNYWGERGNYFCVFSVFTDALFSTGTASDLFNAVPWLFWWKTCW